MPILHLIFVRVFPFSFQVRYCLFPVITSSIDVKKRLSSLPKISAFQKLAVALLSCANVLFGNPAILYNFGPVALRRQIPLVLPLSEIGF